MEKVFRLIMMKIEFQQLQGTLIQRLCMVQDTLIHKIGYGKCIIKGQWLPERWQVFWGMSGLRMINTLEIQDTCNLLAELSQTWIKSQKTYSNPMLMA